MDGQRFSIGDVREQFSLQAIRYVMEAKGQGQRSKVIHCSSKPITYAVTMSELGEDLVHKYQGREPSGRKSNEIVLDHNSKEHFFFA